MLNLVTKKSIFFRYTHKLPAITVLALLVVIASGSAGYQFAYQQYNSNKIPTQNTPGYITVDAARNQVNNFYQQYLHPKKYTPEKSRKIYVSLYGDKNLMFYREYYRHGFDPIVCSSVMPTSVTATSVQPGASAVVNAEAKYPDGSTANIVATLVLNNEGFRIDSITCPGAKGNLPPPL